MYFWIYPYVSLYRCIDIIFNLGELSPIFFDIYITIAVTIQLSMYFWIYPYVSLYRCIDIIFNLGELSPFFLDIYVTIAVMFVYIFKYII